MEARIVQALPIPFPPTLLSMIKHVNLPTKLKNCDAQTRIAAGALIERKGKTI